MWADAARKTALRSVKKPYSVARPTPAASAMRVVVAAAYPSRTTSPTAASMMRSTFSRLRRCRSSRRSALGEATGSGVGRTGVARVGSAG